MGKTKPFAYSYSYNPDPENLDFDVFPTLEKAVKAAVSEHKTPKNIEFIAYYANGTKTIVPWNLYSVFERKVLSGNDIDAEHNAGVWLPLNNIPEHI